MKVDIISKTIWLARDAQGNTYPIEHADFTPTEHVVLSQVEGTTKTVEEQIQYENGDFARSYLATTYFIPNP